MKTVCILRRLSSVFRTGLFELFTIRVRIVNSYNTVPSHNIISLHATNMIAFLITLMCFLMEI